MSKRVNPEFNYASSLPYFRKAGTWAGPDHAWRGDSGPIHVRFTNQGHDPISRAINEAGKTAGHATTDDINGPAPASFGFSQSAMPDLTSSNIHAAVLLIAERAADLIRGRAAQHG